MTRRPAARPRRLAAGARAVAGPLLVVAALVLTGCAAPTDADGEAMPPGPLPPAAPASADARPVVVDTDLGGDDLLALSFLLRHPDVDVRAVTVAGTGILGCAGGADLVADLLLALEAEPLPVACGRTEAGPGATPFPTAWRYAALTGSGLDRDPLVTMPLDRRGAVGLLADEARAVDGLTVVALGPLTNLADLAAQDPGAWSRLAGIHAMGGLVEGDPQHDGIAEWNVAADPAAAEAVLAGTVPLTLVPADVIPPGTPQQLHAPVVGAVVVTSQVPTWWDLAAVAAFAEPDVVERSDRGRWSLEGPDVGRLVPGEGEEATTVVRSLDADGLADAYGRVFAGTRGG